MTKPWDEAPEDAKNGTWTVLKDVDVGTTEDIVAIAVFQGNLIVATTKKILVYRE